MTSQHKNAWRCTVCGYIHPGDSPPEYCPVCGAFDTDFEAYTAPEKAQAQAAVNAWRCLSCNHLHEGPKPPDICPLCAADAEIFEPAEKPGMEKDSAATTGRVIIVGGGIAGVTAAETVRNAAPAAVIELLCQEAAPPYYRLNLTRYLAGEIGQTELPLHDIDWYSQNNIDLQTNIKVVNAKPQEKIIELASGETRSYDALILAMGSHPFVPPLPGADLPGVKSLRTAADADAILDQARRKGACVVIGAGILGIETAGALARQGTKVTLIESHEWLMPRQLNRKAGELLEAYLETLGVAVRKQARTRSITGAAKASGIELTDGSQIHAPLVVLATGVRANTYLARKAGLEVNHGIVVDNHLRTSNPDIYAAGDVAEHNGILYGAWAPSQYQGQIAGLNAVGIATEFGGLPRANAVKLLGVDLLSIGIFEPEDGSYIVLDHGQGRQFAHFVFHDAKLVGAILLDHPRLGTRVKQAIESREDFTNLLDQASTGREVLDHLTAR